MKSVIASIVAVAGIAAAANAQNVYETGTTRAIMEVSTNGSDWSSSMNVAPGTSVAFRVRFVYTGTTSVSKLVEARYQPTISGWGAGDVLAPFYNNGGGTNISSPVGYLANSTAMPTNNHKVQPFAATGQTAAGAGNLTSFVSGSTLRIAGANATNFIGAGATNNNVSGNWGVISAQLAQNGNATTTFLGTDATTFKGLFTVSSATTVRDYVLSLPAASIGDIAGGPTGFKGVYWLSTGSGQATGDVRSSVVIESATVSIVPTPGAAALLGLGGLAAARRRRA